MYVCVDKKAGLPVNKYLDQLKNISGPTVYGDAFIFKQQSELAVLAKKRSRYLNSLVTSVNMFNGHGDCEGEKTLRELWVALNKE